MNTNINIVKFLVWIFCIPSEERVVTRYLSVDGKKFSMGIRNSIQLYKKFNSTQKI